MNKIFSSNIDISKIQFIIWITEHLVQKYVINVSDIVLVLKLAWTRV